MLAYARFRIVATKMYETNMNTNITFLRTCHITFKKNISRLVLSAVINLRRSMAAATQRCHASFVVPIHKTKRAN